MDAFTVSKIHVSCRESLHLFDILVCELLPDLIALLERLACRHLKYNPTLNVELA